jgi:dTDP-glucose pyrophosphorylase
MAGRGSRFSNAGYTIPKPLIPVGGKPMIQWVIENVRPDQEHTFTFICLKEHLEIYPNVQTTLESLCPGCNIVTVDQVTEGAACTVLLAKNHIDNDNHLMIANADQFVSIDINLYLRKMSSCAADGIIMTFESDHPKWSYCRISDCGHVTEVVEKKVVSNEATVGIYNFKHGRDFVRAAEKMISENLRVNNEFYVAPAYNQLINEGATIIVERTGKEYDGMYGLGTPGDLSYFELTSIYDAKRIDNKANRSQYELLTLLTKNYVDFFNSKNIAGVAALMREDCSLIDPHIRKLNGKSDVIDYIKTLFESNKNLSFLANNIYVDGNNSIIEFILNLDQNNYNGVDIIQWKDRKMVSLRAYL